MKETSFQCAESGTGWTFSGLQTTCPVCARLHFSHRSPEAAVGFSYKKGLQTIYTRLQVRGKQRRPVEPYLTFQNYYLYT